MCNSVFKWDFPFDQLFPGKSVKKVLKTLTK